MQLLIALAKTVTNTGTKRTLQCKQLMNKNAIHKTFIANKSLFGKTFRMMKFVLPCKKFFEIPQLYSTKSISRYKVNKSISKN